MASPSCKNGKTLEYPAAPSDSTSYEAFDITVADPYRPLENDRSEEHTSELQSQR